MNKEKLYEILELDTPADFSYFEQMAEIIESDEDVTEENLEDVFSEIDGDTAVSLTENYFEDLSNAAPDDDDELVSLIETVKQSLVFAAGNIENNRRAFSGQLLYFRNWFHAPKGALIDGSPCSVFDAITEYRCEKMSGEKHKYEFVACKDYDLEDLSLGLGEYSKIDILAEEEDDDTED